MTEGKILFYNEQKGKGIIMTPDKEKLTFTIDEWDDFETMPAAGLLVELHKDEANQSARISPEKPQKKEEEQKRHRYKNQELTETEEEVNSLLNDSANSLDVMDRQIKLTANISDTMDKYFENIRIQIKKREGYRKVDGRLKYRLAKRFLWTTYNNIKEIDHHVITPRIQSISKDLRYMSDLYEDFEKKIKYPALAFEDIFLSYQTEYKRVRQLTQKAMEKLSVLKHKEQLIYIQKQTKQKEIEACKDKKRLQELLQEQKVINGTYVDVVHMMAKLQEDHKINTQRLQEFEKKYQNNFNEKFKKEARYYNNFLVDILDAQAYLLDSLLWKEAKVSRAVKAYFKELPVDVELNTKGYLKYYLSTLDTEKTSESSKVFFALYEHLQEIQQDYILIVTASVEDGMDYQLAIQKVCKNFSVKLFVDELSALKWSMRNNVKVIVLEDLLHVSTAEKFLDSYHNNILSKPKIIVLGDRNSFISKQYSVTKILPQSISPSTLANTIKQLFTPSS